jgi:CRP/FNR family transcriptional regulator, cyclic AMP receptor protein
MSSSPSVVRSTPEVFHFTSRYSPVDFRNTSHGTSPVHNYPAAFPGNSGWAALSRSTLEHLNRLKQLLSYPKGTTVFAEGETCRGIFILWHGEVKLAMSNAEGRTLIVGMSGPGELLGLQECLTGSTYGVTLETTTPSEVAFILRQDFLNFLSEHSDARQLTNQQLISDCRAAHDLIRTIGLSQSIHERLARVFLQWAKESKFINGSYRINVGFTHDEIGQLIGVRRETVSRTLSQLKKEGIAEFSGATLLIHSKARLERLAG